VFFFEPLGKGLPMMSIPDPVIWKQVLQVVGTVQQVAMPVGAKVIHIEAQHNKPTIWFTCIVTNPTEMRKFVLVQTGGSMPCDFEYVGTAILDDINEVLHLYEEIHA
jgi:hypothetical protein